MSAVQTRPLGALGRMGVVVGFHAALIFVLASSFGLMPNKADTPEPISTRVIDDTPIIDDDMPPRIGPSLTAERPQLPAPENPPLDDSSENAISGDLVDPRQIIMETYSVGTGPVHVRAAIDPRRPLTQPPYPARLQREGIEGAVDVEVFVQPDGRIGDARIVRSSGHAEFDQVTLDEARRRWRMVPATEDGKPVTQWYRLRVKFKLTNR